MEINITPTVAILTNFAEFNPGYSLTGIVVDQAHMLAREGHKVIIYVNENFNPIWDKDSGLSSLKKKYAGKILVKPLTKFMHLKDYEEVKELSTEHRTAAAELASIYAADFEKEGVSVAFTHDFVFTGWNLPFSTAVKTMNSLLWQNQISVKWFHWIHSIPSGNRDWWSLVEYGANHQLVFPNKTELVRVAETFRTEAVFVKIIPHIKDIRTWYDFGNDAFEFTERYPNIMKANVVQIYPCSTDRLHAKQLDVLIEIFGNLKSHLGMDVFLVAANQWATGKQRKEDVNEYIQKAKDSGLDYGNDFVFTSEIGKEFSTGISKRMLRELQHLSNLFIFPTREESFGLVGPEASFSGAMVVTNRSLKMMMEVMSTHCPSFDFGAFDHACAAMEPDMRTNYLIAVARSIAQRMYHDESLMTKLYCQKRYNMDAIYREYYLPLFD